MIYISIVFLVLAGLAKAVQDVCSDGFYGSRLYKQFKFDHWFWLKKSSWLRKYKGKWIANGIGREWKIDHALIPRFYGSTTFLVWLTDGWHLMDMLNTVFLILGTSVATYCIIFLTAWYWGFAFFALPFLSFHLAYQYLRYRPLLPSFAK